MRASVGAALLGGAILLCGAAPASYDAVCLANCTASDGTTQSAGTALYRFLWDGVASYTPQDAAGVALNAVADPAQNTPIYRPTIANVATAPATDTLITTASGSLAIKHPDSTVSDSGVVVPTPISTVPPAATPAGTPGVTHTYAPADATQPSLTRSTRVTTAADGTFSVTWATPLVSGTPVAPNPAPINTGTQPIQCNYTSVTSSGEAGKCWVAQVTALTLAQVTAGVTVTPNTSTTGVSGISVSVFAREPTQ